MKIAVTGPRGRLGSELVRQGCIPIFADVLNYRDLHSEITDINPDVIIHCAAFTDVDSCELAPKKASEVNTGGTYTLTQAFPGKIVYISTDYIFDGEDGPYSEDAKPNPIGIYGWSKLGGEIALRNRNNPDDLIIRTTVLFDRYSKNFVTIVIERLLSGKTVEVSSQLFGSPTYIPHLAEGILRAIELKLSGVLNIVGCTTVSRYEFACQIAEILGVSQESIFGSPVNYVTPRPLKAGLLIDKAGDSGIKAHHPLDGVREMVNALETMAAG